MTGEPRDSFIDGELEHGDALRRPDPNQRKRRARLLGAAALGVTAVIVTGIEVIANSGDSNPTTVDSAARIASDSARDAASASASRASESTAASISAAEASISRAAAANSAAAASLSSAEAAASSTRATASSALTTTASSPSRTTSAPTTTTHAPAPAPAPRTTFAIKCDADPGYCAPDGGAPVYNAPFLGGYALNANSRNGDASGGVRYPHGNEMLTPICKGTVNGATWLIVHTDPSWAQKQESGQGDPYSGYIEAAAVPGAATAVGHCEHGEDYTRNFK